MPELITTSLEMSTFARSRGKRNLSLVPTMGALHDGHHALVDVAKKESDLTVVSIFVNPTQFGPNEDLDRYPRTLEQDIAALNQRGGVDAVFAPSVRDMYPDGPDRQLVWVTPSSMADVLCGAFRPGHFRGVATVVTKLFAVCQPDSAVFGLKDAQQFVILSKLVRDLGFQIRMVGVPTVREADGLALSSRNRFLSKEEREQSVVLSRAVGEAKRAIESGERDADEVRRILNETIDESDLALTQYVDVTDARTLQPLQAIRKGQHVLSAVAVFFGSTRLIDNSFSIAG